MIVKKWILRRFKSRFADTYMNNLAQFARLLGCCIRSIGKWRLTLAFDILFWITSVLVLRLNKVVSHLVLLPYLDSTMDEAVSELAVRGTTFQPLIVILTAMV